MANDEFREEHQQARAIGKAKLHEKRLEHATYTAAEVRVLTETASKVAYELGRKDAGEEIAAAIAAEYIPVHNVGGADPVPSDPTEWDEALHVAVQIARNLSSQPTQDASDAISGVPRHSEVSEAPKAPQEPYECSCYKLAPGILEFGQHHPDCPNAPRGDA